MLQDIHWDGSMRKCSEVLIHRSGLGNDKLICFRWVEGKCKRVMELELENKARANIWKASNTKISSQSNDMKTVSSFELLS